MYLSYFGNTNVEIVEYLADNMVTVLIDGKLECVSAHDLIIV